MTIEALKQRVGTDLLFHAAGLSDGAGRVVVLVAASGTGKTTAARTLGTRLGYVSDESVAIRPDGSVTASSELNHRPQRLDIRCTVRPDAATVTLIGRNYPWEKP